MRLFLVLAILGSSSASHADMSREELNKVLKNLHPVAVQNQGKDGIWLPKEEAEGILTILEKRLPLALDIIDAQDKQIVALKASMDLYKTSITGYLEYVDYNKKMLDTALGYFPELKPPEYPWYEKPIATYVYGLLSGIAIIVTSSAVLDNIHKN